MVSRTVPGSPGEECGLGVRWGRALTAWVPGLESVDQSVRPSEVPPRSGLEQATTTEVHGPPGAGLNPLLDSGKPCGLPVWSISRCTPSLLLGSKG